MKRALSALLPIIVAACTAAPAPALAGKIIGQTKDKTGTLFYYDGQGPVCVGRSRHVEFVPKKGETIKGCYSPSSTGLFVVFFDGEYADIPADAVSALETI